MDVEHDQTPLERRRPNVVVDHVEVLFIADAVVVTTVYSAVGLHRDLHRRAAISHTAVLYINLCATKAPFAIAAKACNVIVNAVPLPVCLNTASDLHVPPPATEHLAMVRNRT